MWQEAEIECGIGRLEQMNAFCKGDAMERVCVNKGAERVLRIRYRAPLFRSGYGYLFLTIAELEY